MLGICPNCKIDLKKLPNKNEISEMMLILNYRKLIDSGEKPKSIDELGYCEICKATKKEIEKEIKAII